MSAQIQIPTNTNGNAPTAPPSFSEAPASATVEAYDSSGRRWLLTTRAATTGELLTRLPVLTGWLDDHGWQARTPGKAQARGDAANSVQGEPPLCPTHQKPMKPGKNGGWYCPVKLLEDGGDGRPVYCKQRR